MPFPTAVADISSLRTSARLRYLFGRGVRNGEHRPFQVDVALFKALPAVTRRVPWFASW